MVGHQVVIDLLIGFLTNMVRSKFTFSSNLIVRGDFVLGGYCPGGIVWGDIVRGEGILS